MTKQTFWQFQKEEFPLKNVKIFSLWFFSAKFMDNVGPSEIPFFREFTVCQEVPQSAKDLLSVTLTFSSVQPGLSDSFNNSASRLGRNYDTGWILERKRSSQWTCRS